MRALLNHTGAFAIVFTHHNQRATHHAGGRQVAQGIGGHIGTHNRLPGHRAAQRVMNGRTQHGCG